jgi:mRNA interferase MazF
MIRRGDLHAVDLEPVRGAEANKLRPAVIVSNDAANATAARLGRGVVTVVPVTSNIVRIFPFQVALPAAATGLPRDSKAQAEQIRSIDVERIGARLGAVPGPILEDLEDAIRLHLGL